MKRQVCWCIAGEYTLTIYVTQKFCLQVKLWRMSHPLLKRASFFGARLRSRRQALGLSQEAVGVSIGLDESCSRTRISRYETGAHEPAIGISQQLATALGVPMAYLYCEDDTLAEIICLTDQLEIKAKQHLLARLRSGKN